MSIELQAGLATFVYIAAYVLTIACIYLLIKHTIRWLYPDEEEK